MRRGSLSVNIVTLSTSGGHMTCQDFIMCDECFDQGRGGDFKQNGFRGCKKQDPHRLKMLCVRTKIQNKSEATSKYKKGPLKLRALNKV